MKVSLQLSIPRRKILQVLSFTARTRLQTVPLCNKVSIICQARTHQTKHAPLARTGTGPYSARPASYLYSSLVLRQDLVMVRQFIALSNTSGPPVHGGYNSPGNSRWTRSGINSLSHMGCYTLFIRPFVQFLLPFFHFFNYNSSVGGQRGRPGQHGIPGKNTKPFPSLVIAFFGFFSQCELLISSFWYGRLPIPTVTILFSHHLPIPRQTGQCTALIKLCRDMVPGRDP